MTFTLTPHQEQAIQRIVNEQTRSVLCGSELGTGKTAVATESIKRWNQGVNVVTGPLHTLDGWERHFDLLNAGELRFANNKTKTGKLALSDLWFGVPGNYFLGREFARLQDWKGIEVGAWVADESHTLVNPKSRGFKAHQKNKMRTEFRMLQSATWFGSSFENAWSAARLLWPELDGYGEVADRSRYRWIDQWCRTEYDHFAPMNKRVLGERIPGKFVSEVPCYIRMESDLPELEPIVIYYDLSPVQRRIYRQMEQESLAWLNENPLVADLPVVQRIRLREIVLAEPSLNDAGEVHFESTAKSSLVSLVQEMLGDLIGEQIVMGTHSAKFARFAAPHLDNTFAWTGDKSEEQRAHAKKLFMEGSVRNILATYPAAAEGIDGWQNASHVMFELGASDNIVLAEQFRGRLNRRGQSKPVLNYRFVARDTIDDGNYDSLLSRELEMRRSVALDMAHASN